MANPLHDRQNGLLYFTAVLGHCSKGEKMLKFNYFNDVYSTRVVDRQTDGHTTAYNTNTHVRKLAMPRGSCCTTSGVISQ